MASFIFLILGFILLIKGADFLVDGACSLAKRLAVSDLVIGLTVVAFGTSTPELFVNVLAGIKGSAGIAIGNIIGSNICNILLILGVASIIFPLAVTKGTIRREIPICFLAVVVMAVITNDPMIDKGQNAVITRVDGLILLSFFIVFMYYTVISAQKDAVKADEVFEKHSSFWKSIFLVIIGLIALTVGGKWLVEGAVNIARIFGVSESLIGLTIVAIGTSLPELATSVVAAFKKKSDIAIGNVVGSNIFNIFFVLGVSATIRPIPFEVKNNIDILVMLIAHFVLFVSMFTGKKRLIDRWEGILFLVIYVGYIVFLVIRG